MDVEGSLDELFTYYDNGVRKAMRFYFPARFTGDEEIKSLILV
jgi:hypothetical protein